MDILVHIWDKYNMKEKSLLDILDARFEFVCNNNRLPLLIEGPEGVEKVLLSIHYEDEEDDIIEVNKLVPTLLRDNPIFSCDSIGIDVKGSIALIDSCQNALDQVTESSSHLTETRINGIKATDLIIIEAVSNY